MYDLDQPRVTFALLRSLQVLCQLGLVSDGGTYRMSIQGTLIKGKICHPPQSRDSSPPSLLPVYTAYCG